MTIKKVSFLLDAKFNYENSDLVVVAPIEDFTSYCTVRFDLISKIPELEHIGTLPDYHKQGLAKFIISEALKRLQQYVPNLICLHYAYNDDIGNRLFEIKSFKSITEVYCF